LELSRANMQQSHWREFTHVSFDRSDYLITQSTLTYVSNM